MRARLALLPLLALSACEFLGQLRDPESDPQPVELVAADAFSNAHLSMIAGGGASPFVAYTRWDSNESKSLVRLARHDAAHPDELEILADVSAGDVAAVFVQGDVAVLWGHPDITVVDLASPELASRTVATPVFGSGSSGSSPLVAVSGRWLLVSLGDEIALRDLEAPTFSADFTAGSPVTAALSTQDCFLAFTTTGYVHVTPDPLAPTFTTVTDPILRNFKAAFADGAEAIVAGPSLALGKSRVVRLDLASPSAPAVLRSHEVTVPYSFFAWDGGTTSVLATGSGDDSVLEGYVVHEVGDTFTSAGIPLPMWSGGKNPLAAHGGRLFALGYGGFGVYRINR